MKKRIGRVFLAGLIFAMFMVGLSSCKPSYNRNFEQPFESTAADSMKYLDFVQIHNDIVDRYVGDNVFGFVKSLDIDGSVNDRWISLKTEVMSEASDEAIVIFISTILYDISDEAEIQDHRYTKPNEEKFGSVYDDYEVRISVVRGDEDWENTTYSPGDEMPYSPEYRMSF